MALLPPLKLPPLVAPRQRPTAPPVIVIGPGMSVVMVGSVIRIDIVSDDGNERCTRFVTIEEARQLNTALARLSK